jgi:cysteine desulfurase
VQALGPLAALAHRAGALLHADASQSAGKVPLDVSRDGVDLLTLAAHKLYAPKGVGALVALPHVALSPQQLGAGHESGRRAGTENVASIVGFGAACVAAKRDLEVLRARLLTQREHLERQLLEAFPKAVIAGSAVERLPNTLYICLPGYSATELLARAPDLAASTGSACHDGYEAPPAVLLEMGFAPEVARGAVRLSLGRSTTDDDIEHAVELLHAAAQSTRTVLG